MRSYLQRQTEARRQRRHTALDLPGHNPQRGRLSVVTKLFGKTGLKSWQTFDGLAPPQVYPAGTELFRQGERIEELYWIQQGLIKLARVHDDGREMITGVYRPGWVLGATAALLRLPAPATAVTITRCHLRRIGAEAFRHRVELADDLLRAIVQMVSREAYEQALHHVNIGLLSGRERLEQFLWEWLSSMEGVEPRKPIRLQLPLKQWELAQAIAVTPQYLSKLLRQLERDGIIQRRKGWLIIADPEKLFHSTEF